MIYKCAHCFYVYNEEKGEPDCNIKPHTRLSFTPDDYECPLCHTGKDAFIKIENTETPLQLRTTKNTLNN